MNEEASVVLMENEMLIDSAKTMFWPSQRALLIADLHIGKITHFRKAGIALPPQAAKKNISTLIDQIEKYNPEKVIFLGDLFHSSYNEEWQFLEEPIRTYSHIDFILVKGNHDILHKGRYDEKRIQVVDTLLLESILMTHHPLEKIPKNQYNLCGHIHPGIRIKGKAKQQIKLPCFFFGENQGILPAFGTFTGTSAIDKEEAVRLYAIVENQLIKIK